MASVSCCVCFQGHSLYKQANTHLLYILLWSFITTLIVACYTTALDVAFLHVTVFPGEQEMTVDLGNGCGQSFCLPKLISGNHQSPASIPQSRALGFPVFEIGGLDGHTSSNYEQVGLRYQYSPFPTSLLSVRSKLCKKLEVLESRGSVITHPGFIQSEA